MAAGKAIARILRRNLQIHSTPLYPFSYGLPAISSIKMEGQYGFESHSAKSLRALALLGAGVSGLLSFATLLMKHKRG